MPSRPVTRRRVATGAVWAVPVIAVGVAAPAYAASGGGLTASVVMVCPAIGLEGYVTLNVVLSVQNLIGPDVEVLTLTTAFPARTDAVDPPLPVVVPAGPSVNLVATTVIRNSRIPDLPFTIVATITWGQVGGGAGGSVDLPILVSTLDTTLCDNPDLP